MRLFIIGVTCSILFQFVAAQQIFDARGTGMAFSNAADTRGLEQVGLNPATLAIPRKFNFEFNLISANATALNNSFNKNQYDRYFTTGDSLTDVDKSDILNSVPEGGLRADAFARVNTLAFYTRRFSLSLAAIGNGFFKVPRDLIELLFKGNDDIGRVYKFSDLNSFAWGGITALFSGAFPIGTRKISFLDFAAVGFTLKYVAGLGYEEMLKSDGKLFNNESHLRVVGDFEARTARGGKGIGLDIGIVARSREKWTISLAVLNAIGSINWNDETKMHLVSFQTDSLSFPDRLADSLIVDSDTSFAIDEFTMRLPVVLDIGVAYQWTSKLLFTAEYEQGFDERLTGTTRPRVAVGLEFTGVPVLPLRTGVSTGGRLGFSSALGFGINLHHWFIDVGYINHGGFFVGKSKGITLALTTRFRF